jgi:4-amino-4-deoxy-L-arabinose transferase-like glycosyltransferase
MSTVVRAVAAPPASGTAAAPAPARRGYAATARLQGLSPYGWGVVGITLLGLLGRLVLLGRQPLWRDEAFTELASRRSWLDMFDVVRHDSAPPLSYVLTHLATSVSTDSWALRIPAALAGTAAIPLAAALGRRIGGNRCGLFAAALVMLSPPYVLGSRDARMYALAGTMVLAVALALWRAVEKPTRGRLIVLWACVAAALLTQYFTALGIVAAAVAALIVLRPSRVAIRRCAVAMGLGVVPVLIWLPIAAPQLQHADAAFWVAPISGETLLGVLTQFFAGPPVDSGLAYRFQIQVAQGVAITAGALAGVTLIWHTIWRAGPRERRALAYVFGVGMGAVALLLAISLRRSLVEARYASVIWPPLTVLIGVGMGHIRPKVLAAACLFGTAVATAMLVALPLRTNVAPLLGDIGTPPPPHSFVVARSQVYLDALVAAPPQLRSITHVAADHLAWYWGTAVFPKDAYTTSIPGDVTHVYDLYEEWAGAYSPLQDRGFHQVSTRCADGACLTVWER